MKVLSISMWFWYEFLLKTQFLHPPFKCISNWSGGPLQVLMKYCHISYKGSIILPRIRRTESNLKEPTTNVSIQYICKLHGNAENCVKVCLQAARDFYWEQFPHKIERHKTFISKIKFHIKVTFMSNCTSNSGIFWVLMWMYQPYNVDIFLTTINIWEQKRFGVHIVTFWVMILCSLTGGYHNFGSTAFILSCKVS